MAAKATLFDLVLRTQVLRDKIRLRLAVALLPGIRVTHASRLDVIRKPLSIHVSIVECLLLHATDRTQRSS